MFPANPEQLHGSVDDFIAICNDAQDAIQALGDSARDAVSGLLNVPTGFKIALARFNATLDIDMDRRVKDIASGGGLSIDPVHFSPRSVAFAGDGAALPTLAAPSVQFGDIHITVTDSGDPHRTAEMVLQEFRTRARSQSGNTLDWGRLI